MALNNWDRLRSPGAADYVNASEENASSSRKRPAGKRAFRLRIPRILTDCLKAAALGACTYLLGKRIIGLGMESVAGSILHRYSCLISVALILVAVVALLKRLVRSGRR